MSQHDPHSNDRAGSGSGRADLDLDRSRAGSDRAGSSPGRASRVGAVSLTIPDRATLYAAYMPWLKHGGLFLPTLENYQMGERVQVQLRLLDEPDPIPLTGTVVWITPQGAQGNRVAGIGVQFSEADAALHAKLQDHLAGALDADHPTHTM